MADITMGFWFKTPIWRTVLEDAAQMNAILLAEIHRLRESDPEGLAKSNLGGWQSAPDLHRRPAFTPFIQRMEQILAAIVERSYRLIDGVVPSLDACWANINPPGSSNVPHVHANALWSAAYYVSTPQACGDIWFFDPRPGAMMVEYPVSEQSDITASEIQFPVSEGQLLVFPSYLLHSVEVHRGAGERVSISFNATCHSR
jgi:uncharacterized protein (TIGR02466 family)